METISGKSRPSRPRKSSYPRRGELDDGSAPRGWAAARAWLQGSAWTPLAGKALAWAAAFAALAAVGSGAAVHFLPGSGDARLASLIGSPVSDNAGSTARRAGDADRAPPLDRAEQADHARSTAEHATHATPTAQAAEPAAPPAKLGAGPADAGAPPADGGPASGGVTADGKVILNLATEDDLRRLSGIGPAKAKAILALRAKLGRFKRVEDLLRVKGIGRKRLARLRPLVVIDPPAPGP